MATYAHFPTAMHALVVRNPDTVIGQEIRTYTSLMLALNRKEQLEAQFRAAKEYHDNCAVENCNWVMPVVTMKSATIVWK